MIEELMKAADAVLDEATEETLEPEKLTLHKLEQYKKFFDVDSLKQRIEKLEQERDEWRERCKKLVIENIGLQK
jgi:hypothetical protein